MEKQSNDGIGTGINDGDRFINSRVGKKADFMINRYVRGNGLNLKNVKEGKGEKVITEENSHVHENGLNYKITENVAKGENLVRKENSFVRDNGLNDKSTENGKKENYDATEAECKFRMQRQKEAETEEDESDRERSKYKQKQHDRRDNASLSRQKKFNANPSFTVRSVSDEESNQRNSFVRSSGLNKSICRN